VFVERTSATGSWTPSAAQPRPGRAPGLRLLRTETTNDPGAIARNHAMVSANTALHVDLLGQVNASRIGARIHSGLGGQSRSIVGALRAAAGP
jgi:acyl-CoA hydrolase